MLDCTLFVLYLPNSNFLDDGYKIERRHNAEFMAPKNAKLPFLHISNKVVAQEDILDYLYSKSFVLNNDISTEDNMVIQGVISLIETKLVPIEMYYAWIDPLNRTNTLERYGYNYPQPLKKVLCLKKQWEVERYLKCVGVLGKSEEEIKQELHNIYRCIATKLEKTSYLIGDELIEADCYVYGHLQAILESKLKNNIMTKMLDDFPKLTKYVLNFNQLHLGKTAMIWEFV